MPRSFARIPAVIALMATAILPQAGLASTASAADMVVWQEPATATTIDRQPRRQVLRRTYVAHKATECELLRVDYIEGRRDLVRVCHPPVF